MCLSRSLTAHSYLLSSKIFNLHTESDSVAADDDVDLADSVNMLLPGCSFWVDDLPEPTVHSDTEELPQSTPWLQSIEVAPLPADIVPSPSSTAPVEPLTSATATDVQALPTPAEGTSASTQAPTSQLGELNNINIPQQTEPELDPELLELLGEDPTSTKKNDGDIQKDLAIRLNHNATSGLSKETRYQMKKETKLNQSVY